MSDIKESIRRLAKIDEDIYAIVGTIVSVDLDDRSCVVSPLNGDADIHNVWLQSYLHGDTGVLVTPVVGSVVIVVMTSRNTAFVAKTYEVTNIKIDIDELQVKMSSNGLQVTNKGENLATSISDLVSEVKEVVSTIKSLVLLTNQGPTVGVSPTSLASLQSHDLRLDEITSQFNKMLVE